MRTDQAAEPLIQQNLYLKMKGKDVIHVEVEGGITIDGIVLSAQKFGNRFRIDGELKEETEK